MTELFTETVVQPSQDVSTGGNEEDHSLQMAYFGVRFPAR